jgi:glycerol-3-phosphate dehydrogenase
MIPFIRELHRDSAAHNSFDLVVIGGGITGAGIARDGALRGLRVLLLEAGDFCSATSSKSSKLLHGGIRYLEQFHLGLVFEASHERRLHSNFLSPHLAKPVPFLIPVYPWSPHRLPTVAMGVFLYDLLALFRNHGSRVLSRSTALREEDRLAEEGLKGGTVYHDVVMDDVRIGLENVHSAAFYGATTLNYAKVLGFTKNRYGIVDGVEVGDLLDGTSFRVSAKAVVNATGPWCDRLRLMADPGVSPRLRPTKGVHLVLPEGVLGRKHAFVLTAKKDNRVFFSIPWFGRTLVGTTDTDYDPNKDGSMEEIRALPNEVDYLMEGVKRTFPSSTVRDQDILSTFAGLRPLVAQEGSNDPSSVSREHEIWRDSSGLFNIAGGKYTTYRTMAAELLDFVQREVGMVGGPCVTHSLPLVETGLEPKAMLGLYDDYLKELGAELVTHLQERYGARWQNVADLALENSEWRETIVPGEPDILAEAHYCRNFEMAVTGEDFLRRRTLLALKGRLSERLPGLAKALAVFGETPRDLDLKRIQGRT